MPLRTQGKLVDREAELAELTDLLDQGQPRLALLTGRRRVGKTYLLANAWPREHAFIFIAAQTTPELNRRQLLEELSLLATVATAARGERSAAGVAEPAGVEILSSLARVSAVGPVAVFCLPELHLELT